MTDTLSMNGRTRLQANRRDGQVWSALPGGCERSESDGASRPYLYRCFASPPTPVHPAPPLWLGTTLAYLEPPQPAWGTSRQFIRGRLGPALRARATPRKNAPEGAGLETVGLETVARPLGAKCGRQATPKRETGEGSITPAPQRGARIRGAGAMTPTPVLGSCDADVIRASQLQHAVQDLDRHVHLRRPTLIRTRAQPVPDHALEPADGGLGPGARVVARGLLPAHPA